MIEPCSIPEAARMLGVKVPTIRSWVHQRRLPFFKLGRRVVFDQRDIQQFLEKNRVEAIDVEAAGK